MASTAISQEAGCEIAFQSRNLVVKAAWMGLLGNWAAEENVRLADNGHLGKLFPQCCDLVSAFAHTFRVYPGG